MPRQPGVYWFLDAAGKVIYVGKAKNLNNRLRSYSHLKQLSPKTSQLVQSAAAVKYTVLDSEWTALLTEAELIQLYQPHFNILLKDDRSPLYIITTKETYPRVLAVRKSDRLLYPLHRSFGPFSSSFQVKEVLKIARKIFPYCTAPQTKQLKKCFYVHLGLCPGACNHTISPATYQQNIANLELFLQGKHRHIINDLTKQIEVVAKAQDYEAASLLKQKIDAITYIVNRYHNKSMEQPLPNITENTGTHRTIELIRLLKEYGLPCTKLDRIETYDVANLQGTSAAVSMVVAINGTADHDQYRHFSIKTLNTPNDVGMLKEAITRRQQHPEWGIPDLIVVDGGKPQVKAVAQVLSWSVPVVGIAKQPDRLLIPTKTIPPIISSITLDPSSPVGSLIISMRDEAHRFSRRLHHKKINKKIFE